MPVGFGPQRRSDHEACAGGVWLQEQARTPVGCGICFCGCYQRQGTGGDGGLVPVGFGPQRRSDSEARLSVCWWDLAPAKQQKRAGVSRMPVGFGLAEAARMEVTAACAGGICFCGCNQRRGDRRCLAARWR